MTDLIQRIEAYLADPEIKVREVYAYSLLREALAVFRDIYEAEAKQLVEQDQPKLRENPKPTHCPKISTHQARKVG